MELDWSTFLLELLNFLVLVWILKHFLYRPVLEVIARRRQTIEKQLADIEQEKTATHDLKAQYEGRVAAWENERRDARNKLTQELDAERARQLESLQRELAQERKKAAIALQKQKREGQRAAEQAALGHAATFAARLLKDAAGPELEERLTELLLTELKGLSDERRDALRQQWGERPDMILVRSAFAIDTDLQARLRDALQASSGLDVPITFERSAELVAGLHITIGAWAIAANVRDELRAFAEFAHAPR